ncbi:MAG: hypothetical protein JRE40_00280 [Deltaproteobacteria bacterium]|nr:hypothetical protein [Deltaproteobacteria bacterium]
MTDQVKPLTLLDDEVSLVGHLEAGKFGITCPQCASYGPAHTAVFARDISIYLINILPYNQDCQRCGRMIVEGDEAFPVLFD